MSEWMEVEGVIECANAKSALHALGLLLVDIPSGSEGPASAYRMGRKGCFFHGNLRDRGEDYATVVLSWFQAVLDDLGAESVSDAELYIYGYRWCYLFTLHDGRLELVIPPMYRTSELVQ